MTMVIFWIKNKMFARFYNTVSKWTKWMVGLNKRNVLTVFKEEPVECEVIYIHSWKTFPVEISYKTFSNTSVSCLGETDREHFLSKLWCAASKGKAENEAREPKDLTWERWNNLQKQIEI